MSDSKPAMETLPAGAVFGKYTIVRVIGTGGMGAVYEATHADLQKRVALKVIHREMATHADVVKRFMREGASASKIRHPHVVDVSDFGVHDGVPYLVMEYLQGESLSALIRREHPLAIDRVADLMLAVCAAVAAAHEEGVIHRDLKPDNVFLARSRGDAVLPKVVDFGISKVETGPENHGLTATGAMLGTPVYMSPEQFRTSKYADARSDQYALGVILYEATTGQRPFTGETLYELMNKVVHGEVKLPRALREDLPEALEQAILRAMNTVPDMRFPDVRSLGRALLPFASSRGQFLWQSELNAASGGDTTLSQNADVSGALAAIGSNPPKSVPTPPPGTLANNGREITVPPSRSSRGFRGAGVGAVAVLIAVGAYSAWRFTRTTHPRPAEVLVAAAGPGVRAVETQVHVDAAPRTYAAHVTVSPPTGRFTLDGERAGSSTLDRTLARDGQPHLLRVQAEGYQTLEIAFTDSAPPAIVTLVPVTPPPPPATGSPATVHTSATPGATHAATPHETASTTSPDAARPRPERPAVGTNGAAIIE